VKRQKKGPRTKEGDKGHKKGSGSLSKNHEHSGSSSKNHEHSGNSSKNHEHSGNSSKNHEHKNHSGDYEVSKKKTYRKSEREEKLTGSYRIKKNGEERRSVNLPREKSIEKQIEKDNQIIIEFPTRRGPKIIIKEEPEPESESKKLTRREEIVQGSPRKKSDDEGKHPRKSEEKKTPKKGDEEKSPKSFRSQERIKNDEKISLFDDEKNHSARRTDSVDEKNSARRNDGVDEKKVRKNEDERNFIIRNNEGEKESKRSARKSEDPKLTKKKSETDKTGKTMSKSKPEEREKDDEMKQKSTKKIKENEKKNKIEKV